MKGETTGVSLADVNTVPPLVDGRVYFAAVDLPYAATLTGARFLMNQQGSYTADNNNRIGLYTYSAGTLTLVASSTNNGNLWKAAVNSLISEPFSSTYVAAASLYYVAFVYNNSAQTTAPTLGAKPDTYINVSLEVDLTNSAKITGYVAGADIPSSQSMSGLTTNVSRFWVGLY